MKRALSSLDVRALVGELQWALGSVLDKAYQPDERTVVLRFRKRGSKEEDERAGKFDLLIIAGAWLCVSTRLPEMPQEPTSFAMAVRKHLGGSTLLDVRQLGFDRVVELHLARGKDVLRLVAELFADGNVVIVSGDGTIVQPLVSTGGKRAVRARQPYAAPPPRPDPTKLDYDAFAAALRAEKRDVVRALAAGLGLGGPLAEALLTAARVDKHTPVAEVQDTQAQAVYDAWRDLLARVGSAPLEPAIAYADGAPQDVAPVPLPAEEGRELVRLPSFHEALDRYWHELPAEGEEPQPVEAERRLVKLRRQREHQRAAIAANEAEELAAKRAAEALFLHYAQVEEALAFAQAGKPHALLVAGEKGAALLRLAAADGETVEAPVDPRLDVRENAQRLYARAKKARGKLDGARAALLDTERAVAETEKLAVEQRAAAEKPEPLLPRERRFWFENFRWFVASTGNMVLGGRDAASNERVVKRYLDDGDRYCHADVHGAASVVVKKRQGAVPEAALREACLFAAVLSKAWGHTVVADAYWVTPEQVSKSPQPGEFVPRGGFIIRGERNWARNQKLEAAVGLVRLAPQGEVLPRGEPPRAARAPLLKVMGGPPAALEAWSDRFVVLEPGEEPRQEVARALAERWGVPAAAVERAMPPGDVRVAREVGA